MNNRKLLKTVQYVILVTGVVLILLPMFLVVITAFKFNLQIADNWFSFRFRFTWIILKNCWQSRT